MKKKATPKNYRRAKENNSQETIDALSEKLTEALDKNYKLKELVKNLEAKQDAPPLAKIFSIIKEQSLPEQNEIVKNVIAEMVAQRSSNINQLTDSKNFEQKCYDDLAQIVKGQSF